MRRHAIYSIVLGHEVCIKSLLELKQQQDNGLVMSNSDFLKYVFESFSSYGLSSSSDPTSVPTKETLSLDSFRFSKFCRDAKLMKGSGGLLEPQDVDLIFMKCKTSSIEGESAELKKMVRQKKRKINFHEFKCSIRLIAAKLEV